MRRAGLGCAAGWGGAGYDGEGKVEHWKPVHKSQHSWIGFINVRDIQGGTWTWALGLWLFVHSFGNIGVGWPLAVPVKRVM